MKRREKQNHFDAILRGFVWAPLLLGGIAAAMAAANSPLVRKWRKLMSRERGGGGGKRSQSNRRAQCNEPSCIDRRKHAAHERFEISFRDEQLDGSHGVEMIHAPHRAAKVVHLDIHLHD